MKERGRKLGRRLFFYVLYKILHNEVSHACCSREVTATKCTKTFDATPSLRSEDHFFKIFFSIVNLRDLT